MIQKVQTKREPLLSKILMAQPKYWVISRQVNEVHLNVSQNVIVTTEDKLRIHLSKNVQRIEKHGKWVAPLGILISLLLSLVTADFKNYGLKSSTWEAIFIMGVGISTLWLIYARWQRRKAETIDQVIEGIKRKVNRNSKGEPFYEIQREKVFERRNPYGFQSIRGLRV